MLLKIRFYLQFQAQINSTYAGLDLETEFFHLNLCTEKGGQAIPIGTSQGLQSKFVGLAHCMTQRLTIRERIKSDSSTGLVIRR